MTFSLFVSVSTWFPNAGGKQSLVLFLAAWHSSPCLPGKTLSFLEKGRILQACVSPFYPRLIFMAPATRPAAWDHVELPTFALKVRPTPKSNPTLRVANVATAAGSSFGWLCCRCRAWLWIMGLLCGPVGNIPEGMVWWAWPPRGCFRITLASRQYLVRQILVLKSWIKQHRIFQYIMLK